MIRQRHVFTDGEDAVSETVPGVSVTIVSVNLETNEQEVGEPQEED